MFSGEQRQALKTLLECREEFSPVELALLEKTRKYSKYVSWIPWLRMIAVCNSIAMKNAEQDSDIDLFILTDQRRMWLVRFLVTVIFHLLWVRRHGEKTAHRFCLSFFATTRAMDFSAIALHRHSCEGRNQKSMVPAWSGNDSWDDPYLAYWCETLIPIVDQEDTYAQFRSANEHWIYGRERKVESEKLMVENGLLDNLDQLIEGILKPKTLRTWERLGRPWWVIISDDMLKFHPRDKRREVAQAFIQGE